MTDTIEAVDTVRLFGRQVEYKWIVASIYVAALFLDILDVTIVNVALPQLGLQLHSVHVEWVVIGYTLSLAVAIPLAGWWSDTVGTKRAFLISLAFFIGGSMACGFAHSMTQLILFRVLQGIGGGMLTPVGMAIMYRAFKPSERARAATVVMVPSLAAPALGPIIGGLLVTDVGWRWIFWVNFPIGLFAFIFAVKFLREHREPTAGRFDLPGFILSGAGLSMAVFALSDGTQAGWTAPNVLITGILGSLLLIAFVRVELRTEEPMLDLRLLKERMFRNANIVMSFAMASFLGLLFVLPLYLQNYRGYSALRSGLSTFPQAIGVITTGQIVGRFYRRIGPRRLVTTGFGLAALVILGFTRLGADTSLWWVRGLMFSRGLAMGIAFMPIQAACYANIKAPDMGRASSIYSTMRQVSISVGVAVLSSILALYTPLVGNPVGAAVRARALHGYHVAILASVILCATAAVMAFFFIRDEDALATLSRPAAVEH